MAITLRPETEKRLQSSIKRFFEEKLDDAQAWMQGKVADLDGSRFEPELTYWKPEGSK